ncbi:MAG TPA: GH116 family glycosyl hydrolase [Phycisphaerae bacterium]|nr:GH116 family glycosyl hydrolase [Phycisphaerae bacterium]
MTDTARAFNGPYEGRYTEKIAFPLGGFGAGMVCLEGRGALSHVSLRHRPDLCHEPLVLSAVFVRGAEPPARVLEGPVPAWKVYGRQGSGGGWGGKHYGLPRFAEASFEARLPFGTVRLADAKLPLRASVTGWSPFVPGDADASSLPVAALEYEFENTAPQPVEAVYSFHSRNFMAVGRETPGQSVGAVEGGFVLRQAGSEERPWDEGAFAAMVLDEGAAVDCCWFRGGWFDPLSVLWRGVQAGRTPSKTPVTEGEPSPGASLFVPLALGPGQRRTVRLLLCWYVPHSDLCTGGDCGQADSPKYRPWYAGRFGGIEEVAAFWREHYDELRGRTRQFTDCFYDTTLPPEVVEAVGANLAILKTPTVLRQADGRLWGWEGCHDSAGCCPGSCSHVWNYAQAVPHLFPALERALRETEFVESQDDRGHQNFRSWLPIRPSDHAFHAAADGQLGGVLRVWREWRIGGDTEWLRAIWPRVAASLDYCIESWDPAGEGVLREAHHNTYDIEFWGADGMCSSIYLGALKAAAAMAEALGEDGSRYAALYEKGRTLVEAELYNGEYFHQKTQWTGLRTGPMELAGKQWNTSYSPDAMALFEAEGPKYQYGTGCLSDGVLGAWLAEACGVGEVLDPAKVASHLRSVHRCNFRADLSDHANCQRPGYALGAEAGLLLCSWPRGGKPTLPFPYSDEVWTGIEYQAAAHMILMGLVDEGLEVVRGARRRYDGLVRDPFDEYECGHWYARALSSFALIAALTGARYDAVEKTLHLAPRIEGDWHAPLFTATGFGTVGVRAGEPFLIVRSGCIDVRQTAFIAR